HAGTRRIGAGPLPDEHVHGDACLDRGRLQGSAESAPVVGETIPVQVLTPGRVDGLTGLVLNRDRDRSIPRRRRKLYASRRLRRARAHAAAIAGDTKGRGRVGTFHGPNVSPGLRVG